jgi:hypothetical protein
MRHTYDTNTIRTSIRIRYAYDTLTIPTRYITSIRIRYACRVILEALHDQYVAEKTGAAKPVLSNKMGKSTEKGKGKEKAEGPDLDAPALLVYPVRTLHACA